ncbi:retrovirus polyprotein [Ceratocystis lukuohia]|uniref:Retrovirus polyprotein n=1 Tax=Ceratocystis lukuohia TaxID=2019550 RepID=A0ABR4MA32_9PEZI
MPLTTLTKKDQPFVWGPGQQEAFDKLRQTLISVPVLATYDPDRPTIVEADASGWAMGASLRQQGLDSLWRPVAYFSRKLTPAEVNYPIHDKEMLAIFSCLKHWRPFLAGLTFQVHTDHRNLVYFQTRQTLSERQRRWSHELSEFDSTLIHRPGTTQVTSDALSRRDQDLPHDLSDDRLQSRVHQMLRPCGKNFVIAAAIWAKNPDKDPEGLEVTSHPSLPSPFSDPELHALWDTALRHNERYWQARLAVQEKARTFPNDWGLPWQISECSLDSETRLLWRERLWIPAYEPLRTALIQATRDSSLTGHPGTTITRDLVSRSYTWPGLTEDVRRFVGNCDTCGRSKIWREQKRGLLKPLPIPKRTWQEIAVDFIVDLPPSNRHTVIMGVTDRLSKSKVFIPLKSSTARDVAEAFLVHVFAHHGTPHAITSDRGPQFVSIFWAEVCRQLGITRRLSTSFHPETDGAQESSNQEIETYLRAFTAYLQDDWASLLPQAQIALNNRVSASTGISPFFFCHGFHVDPIETKATRPIGSSISPATAGHNWLAKHCEATAFSQASMALAQEVQERHANKGRQVAESFQVGDKVYLKLKNVRTLRPSKKLDWLALPYKVIGLVGSHAVKLDTPYSIHPVFHVNLVRRHREDQLPSQVFSNPEPPR